MQTPPPPAAPSATAQRLSPVLPGISVFSIFAERFGYDFNGHLVEHASGNLCIDPVELCPLVLEELARRGVARIVLTNRNHFRDAEKLRLATGAAVIVHPADAAFVRGKGVTVEGALAFGDRIGPFTAIDASGKSPGEAALYWPERRILIVGDACVGKAPGVLGLLPDKVIDDLPALRKSLARIAESKEIDFDTLLVGDGHSILEDARAALQALIKTI